MNLDEFCNKYGKVKALKAIGKNKLASQLEKAEKYIQSVVNNEGIMPFEKRPKSTQSRLISANDIVFKVDDLLHRNRKKSVNPIPQH